MSECKTCGRDDGHWLGCAGAQTYKSDPQEAVVDDGVVDLGQCTFAGCTEPRRSADKRVKFCETHSDPKNRK